MVELTTVATAPLEPAVVDNAVNDQPSAVVDLGYTVSVDAFSGPLDLLLFLVRKSELDIIDIPVATIADQFVALVSQWQRDGDLDLEAAGDFILLAATLLEIKARTIAPPPVDENERASDEEDDLLDPRADLIGKLLAYRRFKEAVGLLNQLEAARALRVTRQLREEIPEDPDEAAGIDLGELDAGQLNQLWTTLLARLGGGGPRTVMKDDLPIELSIRKLSDQAEQQPELSLHALFAAEPSLQGRVSMLMATLECARQRIVHATQVEQYGDVTLRFRPPPDRLIVPVEFPPEEASKKRKRRPPLVTFQAPAITAGEESEEAAELEEKHETDEERFLRELNESCDLDGVLARVHDVEKGFQQYWEVLHPPAPQPPVIIPVVNVAPAISVVVQPPHAEAPVIPVIEAPSITPETAVAIQPMVSPEPSVPEAVISVVTEAVAPLPEPAVEPVAQLAPPVASIEVIAELAPAKSAPPALSEPVAREPALSEMRAEPSEPQPAEVIATDIAVPEASDTIAPEPVLSEAPIAEVALSELPGAAPISTEIAPSAPNESIEPALEVEPMSAAPALTQEEPPAEPPLFLVRSAHPIAVVISESVPVADEEAEILAEVLPVAESEFVLPAPAPSPAPVELAPAVVHEIAEVAPVVVAEEAPALQPLVCEEVAPEPVVTEVVAVAEPVPERVVESVIETPIVSAPIADNAAEIVAPATLISETEPAVAPPEILAIAATQPEIVASSAPEFAPEVILTTPQPIVAFNVTPAAPRKPRSLVFHTMKWLVVVSAGAAFGSWLANSILVDEPPIIEDAPIAEMPEDALHSAELELDPTLLALVAGPPAQWLAFASLPVVMPVDVRLRALVSGPAEQWLTIAEPVRCVPWDAFVPHAARPASVMAFAEPITFRGLPVAALASADGWAWCAAGAWHAPEVCAVPIEAFTPVVFPPHDLTEWTNAPDLSEVPVAIFLRPTGWAILAGGADK